VRRSNLCKYLHAHLANGYGGTGALEAVVKRLRIAKDEKYVIKAPRQPVKDGRGG
jgi:hypothetical protein